MKSNGQPRLPLHRASTTRPLILVIILSTVALAFAGGAGAKLKAAFFQTGDIGVTKTGPDTANADTNVSYTINVFAAAGQDDISSATLNDPLPPGMTFVSLAHPAAWSCIDPGVGNNGTVTCTNATFPAGSNDTFTITAHIDPKTAPGSFFTNQATVSGSPNDFDENDIASATTQIPGTDADISVSKTAPSQVHANTDVTYVLTVRNLGPNDATNASFTDTLPPGSPSSPMTFVSFNQTSGPTWNCGSPSATTTCTIATLAVGATSTFNFVGHVPNGTGDSTEYTNIATVTSDHDPNPENNSGVAGTTVFACFTGQTVTTNADSGAGSLRQAILDACDGGTIGFDMSQVVSPIALTTDELLISKNLTISGPGAGTLTVQRSTDIGTPGFRVFEIAAQPITVNISGLTISNGHTANAAAGNNGVSGGGILNNSGATLNLDRVVINNNQAGAAGSGGGFFGGFGGGIANFGGTLNLTNSTIDNNEAGAGTSDGNRGGFGGGISNGGQLTIRNSTISNNSAGASSLDGGLGGGIWNSNASGISIQNSTISGNAAGPGCNLNCTGGQGGGIYNNGGNFGSVILTNATVSANQSGAGSIGGDGGGIFNNNSTVFLRNTIVAGNTVAAGGQGPNLAGTYTSHDNNLIGDASGATFLGATSHNILNQNAKLGPLADYGGPTKTHLLLPGSPAIDAGDNCVTDSGHCSDANVAQLATDQRGFGRTINNTVDMGAVEVNYAISASAGTPQSTLINTAFGTLLQATVTESGNLKTGIPVTFTAPASGPSGSFSGGVTTAVVNTDVNGVATAPGFTANGTAGPYNVVGSVGPTANFALTNLKGNQTIAFAPIANHTFGDADFAVNPTASSGLVVSLSASGQCTVTTPSPGTVHITAAGSCTIAASQAGNANYNAAPNLTQSFTIAKAATTASLSSSLNPSDLNQTVTFTATVSSPAGTPTGTFQFKDNGNSLGSPIALNASGLAQFSTSSLTAGNHAITADYSGDGNFLPSSGALAGGQTVLFRPLIKFSQPNYSVGENGNFITITVVRSGDTSPTVSVDYATPDDSAAMTFLPCSNANGVASPRCDFTTALGTLKFGPGETSKTFTVLISQDVWVEGNETAALTLSNPTGGAAFQQSSDANAVLTIVDDDLTPPTTNPIDNTDTFVRQHYHDFLNREGDQQGIAFWTNQIESCGVDAQCRAVRRVNVSAAFFLSIEFQNTGYFVYRMYKAGFGDIAPQTVPVPIRFTTFLRDTQIVETGVVVGQGNWQAQLDANKKAYALAFVQRTEFLNRYPALTSATAFVDSLNANAGMVLSDSERSALIAELSAGPSDPALRADVLQKIAENALLQQREFNRAFVLMQYLGYLRRNPDAAPEPGLNFNGFNFWLNKLNQFNGDYIGAEMIKAYLNSSEYRGRFGP